MPNLSLWLKDQIIYTKDGQIIEMTKRGLQFYRFIVKKCETSNYRDSIVFTNEIKIPVVEKITSYKLMILVDVKQI